MDTARQRQDPDRLLVGLSGPQREAVTAESGLLCVVAGAGSGKTTVLTRRVAWRLLGGTADADHALVLTFTRKAASELRGRLVRLGAPAGVWAGTFHSAAFALLRRHWLQRDMRPPALVSDPGRLLREVTSDLAGVGPEIVAALAVEIGWARARLCPPSDYPSAAAAARRRTPMAAEQVALVMERYEVSKRRKRVIDLDDLVVRAGDLLQEDDPVAAAERWRFRHLFVDEFQDVNPAQWRLLQGWHAGREDLCVVGDPRQAIYAWNGSDPDLLGRLPVLLPAMHVVHLEENHRSAPEIVAAATAVLGDSRAVAAREAAGRAPALTGFEDEDAEAAAIARWLRSAHRPGRPWRHLAVLARTNARLDEVAEVLSRSGIPFRRPGAAATGTLQGVIGALRGLRRDMPLRAGLVDAMAAVEERSEPRISDAEDDASPRADHQADGEALERLVDDYSREDPRPSVGGFLAWLAANPGATDPAGAGVDAVELVTFHRAKGLQWPCVAVIGLEDGTVPIAYAATEAAVAEERRLLYVAMTRAEDELFCSWAAAPGHGAWARPRQPSPFLLPLRSVIADLTPVPTGEPPTHIAALRTRLALSTRV